MTITPVALLKAQLTLDHDLDDALLQHKLAVAEEWIASFIGMALPDPLPAPITEAALQLAAYWYQQREAASFGVSTMAVPFGVHDFLRPYRAAITGRDHGTA